MHLIRIENMVESGTPDVEGCYDGLSFWLELKSTKRPRFLKTPVRFPTRPEQIDWSLARLAAGGSAGFLLSVANGNGSARAVYLIGGWHGPALHRGLTEEALMKYSSISSVKPTPLDVIQAATRLRQEP